MTHFSVIGQWSRASVAALLLATVATAQVPELPKLAESETPPSLGTAPTGDIVPVVAKVVVAEPKIDGEKAFEKMVETARAEYAKVRDYAGHIVRQERVDGTLLSEQVGEIRVRTKPYCIQVKMLAPKSASGWEVILRTGKRDDKVRFKPAGVAGVDGYQILNANDPKIMAETRHTVYETGIEAILNRSAKIVSTEKRLNNPVQVLAAEYKFQDRLCDRYDVFTERTHPGRYCARSILYVDKETKLPVRFEAYETPKNGETLGDMIECISFVNLKFNIGIGDSVFMKSR